MNVPTYLTRDYEETFTSERHESGELRSEVERGERFSP